MLEEVSYLRQQELPSKLHYTAHLLELRALGRVEYAPLFIANIYI